MFAFLAPLITRVFWGSLFSRAKTNAVNDWHAIPPKARLWIIVAVAVLVLGLLHQWYAHRQLKAQYKAGYAAAVADIKAAEAKKVTQLKDIKQTAEAKLDVKQAEVKQHATQQNNHVDSNIAELLGLYTTPPSGLRGGPGGSVPAANAAAGPELNRARADDGLADRAGQVAGGEPTITVPAKQLITRAGTCDRDYIALRAWEQTYRDYMVAYDEWLAKAGKVK